MIAVCVSADPDPLLNAGRAVPLYVRLIGFAEVGSRMTEQGYPYRSRLAMRTTRNLYTLHDGWLIHAVPAPPAPPPQHALAAIPRERGCGSPVWSRRRLSFSCSTHLPGPRTGLCGPFGSCRWAGLGSGGAHADMACAGEARCPHLFGGSTAGPPQADCHRDPLSASQEALGSVPAPRGRRPGVRRVEVLSGGVPGWPSGSAARRDLRPATGCAGGVAGCGPVPRGRRSIMRLVSWAGCRGRSAGRAGRGPGPMTRRRASCARRSTPGLLTTWHGHW